MPIIIYFQNMQRISKINLNQIHVFLLGAIAASFPFYPKINTLLIIGSVLVVIAQKNFLIGLKNAAKERYVQLLWLLFIAYIISGLTSTNGHEGRAIIERHSSLFILPILFFSSPLLSESLKKISLAFVAAVLSAFGICLIWAFKIFLSEGNSDVFFYHPLTSVIHVSAIYMASYAVLAIHILLFYKKYLTTFLFFLSLISLIIFCFLLNSKMMIACLCLSLFIFGIKNFKHTQVLIYSLSFLIVISTVVFCVPKISERITTELNTNFDVVNQTSYVYNTPFSGTSLRLVFWKYSFQILNERNAWLTGVGTGDFQGLLNQKYKAVGLYTGNPEIKDTGYLGYGPHNQYIEIFLSMGVFTLLLFIFSLVYCFKKAIQFKNYLALQFILLYSLFFLTEAALATNKGIVPFVFFFLLFVYPKFVEKKTNN